MIPGAGSIISESGNWATDFSITNPGTAATTVTLYFASFSDAIPAIWRHSLRLAQELPLSTAASPGRAWTSSAIRRS